MIGYYTNTRNNKSYVSGTDQTVYGTGRREHESFFDIVHATHSINTEEFRRAAAEAREVSAQREKLRKRHARKIQQRIPYRTYKVASIIRSPRSNPPASYSYYQGSF